MVIAPFDFNSLPTSPGVYLMKNNSGEVIYIGKAKNIKTRIRQYFQSKSDNRFTIPFLISQITTIDTITVRNEIEALILENNLIKKYKPKYNILLKDDSSFFNLVINKKELWPKIYLERSKKLQKSDKQKLIFGPYPKAEEAKKLLNSLLKLFPLRTCSNKEFLKRSRPCILFDMKKCLGPCVHLCSHQEYSDVLENAILLLQGKNSSILTNLQQQLKTSIKEEQFELSTKIYKTIQLFKELIKNQEVDNLPLKASDILGIYQENNKIALSILSIQQGKLLNKYQILVHEILQTKEEIISSFLIQYYSNQPSVPLEILLPFPINSKLIQETLFSLIKRKIKIIVPKQKLKKSLINLAINNAKNYLKQKLNSSANNHSYVLLQLFETCLLQNYPSDIDCFDTSHLFGEHPVGVCISVKNGIFNKKNYRKFLIKTHSTQNDHAMLEEIITRRYSKEKTGFPDLIIIDGGKGHLETAYKILHKLEITSIDVIALSKENQKHNKSLVQEKIFTKNHDFSLSLSKESDLLFFLQRIRDEAHRFAISFHKNQRNKYSLISTIKIPGIGEKKTKVLLNYFGSWNKIFQASYEELIRIPEIRAQDAKNILNYQDVNSYS